MTVSIENVVKGEGWGNYVIHNRPGATTLLGDATLGDEICRSIDYKSGNSVNFVISFAEEDDVGQEEGRRIAKEFMQSYMHGFGDDEYHLDLVEHTDSDHLHYHARIPKLNLLTNTQLKLYWHKTDLGYKKAIIDDICHRYGLVTGLDMKNTIPNPMKKLNQINEWRWEHSQEPLDLSRPKLRRETEKKISEYISEGVGAGLINSLDEVKRELLSLEVSIVNEGYDKGKQFHYLTIENESGKIRLKGDIYGKEFYGLTREDREESISSNQSLTTRGRELGAGGTDTETALQREYVKRIQFIEKQYGRARARVYQAQDQGVIGVDNGRSNSSNKELEGGTRDNQRETNRSASADPHRGEADSQDRRELQQESITDDRGAAEAIGKEKQYPTMDDTLCGMVINDNVRDTEVRTTVSRPDDKEISRSEIYNSADERWLEIDKQKELDDRIRAEVSDTVRTAGGSLYARAREDNSLLSREYETSKERDTEAKQSVKAIRRDINQLADKYQSEAVRQLGEHAERYEEEFKQAVGRARGEQSAISKSYEELESGLRRGVEQLEERVKRIVGEFKKGIRERINQLFTEVIEKPQEVEVTQERRRGRKQSKEQTWDIFR